MKKSIKKLSLNAETLRHLTNPELVQVVGGRRGLDNSRGHGERRAYFDQMGGGLDLKPRITHVPEDLPFDGGGLDLHDLYGGGRRMP
ncbi:MAG: class I lanthipeptide [Phycisphaerae bacterium]|nr:class I lanthipeptide [Phycisphaerae bacterium]